MAKIVLNVLVANLFRMSINLFNPERSAENAITLPPGEHVLQNRGHVHLSYGSKLFISKKQFFRNSKVPKY